MTRLLPAGCRRPGRCFRAGTGGLSRRDLFAAGAGFAALPASLAASAGNGEAVPGRTAPDAAPRPPFDSIRDWVAALEAHGLLVRIPEVDQDAFHATALIYHATDRFSWWGAPAFLFERVRIDGDWVRGPLLANLQSHMSCDSIIWGLETTPGDYFGNYRRAKAHMRRVFDGNGGRWPTIPPRVLDVPDAPCKEVIQRGDEIDLTRFAFIQTNPADGGRYINSGSVFTQDPEMGRNYGTYRCQIKGPRKVGLNPEKNQGAWRMIVAARERGDTTYPVAIAVGQDPVVFMISSTKVAGFGGPRRSVDELELAGGLRGKPLDVVRCEDSELLVPAHAEMIIEGEVLLDEPLEPEGPFGEMYGYLGPQDPEKFWMRVNTVTHRRNPWVTNMFTGMERGMVTAPLHTLIEAGLRKRFPYFVEFYQPHDTMGITYVTIDKTEAGQGMEIATAIARTNPIAKITVALDDDVDLLNRQEVLRAITARWQPHPATAIIERAAGVITDPSPRETRVTSKIAIDATRQWPEEGGPDIYAGNNRDLLNELAPKALDEAVRLFDGALDDWTGV